MLEKEGAAGPGALAIVGDQDEVEAGLWGVAVACATDVVVASFASGDDAVRAKALLRRMNGS